MRSTFAIHQGFRRAGDRQIGLARARGADAEDEFVAADRLDVGALRGSSRHHQLAPRADGAAGDVGFLCLAHADRPLHLTLGNVEAAARPVVEGHQHIACSVASRITAAHREPVAPGGDVDIQPVLENGEVLVMLAAEQ
jgi:hypothetical protein